MDALAGINLRNTPQTERADARQVVNNAGGYTFQVTPEVRLNRFLTLGVEGGTYYVGEKELAQDNATVVLDFARNRTAELVAAVVEISTAGRAPKQNPALFALAAAASLGDLDGRRAAFAAVPLVARTATHLYQFTRYAEQFRGWGRGLRGAITPWYTKPSIEDLAYQILKYRKREEWSHFDVLRLAHPETSEDARRRIFDWICVSRQGENPNSPRYGQTVDLTGLRLIEGFERARRAPVRDIPNLVREYRLTWEMLPDAALNEASTWEALLDNGMPATALMRQLPRLTNLGLLSPLGARTREVAERLADPARLRKGRVHPISVLIAQRTYASGRSMRGSSTWTPSRPITDALDAAFYAAFGSITPTGKRYLLALDVSGSMGNYIPDRSQRPRKNSYDPVPVLPITSREASAALALATAATESHYEILGFTATRGYYSRGDSELRPLAISPRQRLDDAIRAVSSLPFGDTDCSLPMLYALKKKISVDVFVIYTDNETFAGQMHPHQALAQYRREINPNAKLVVVAMTSTGFTIADPADAGMLDVAGFDAAVPNLLADFARGADGTNPGGGAKAPHDPRQEGRWGAGGPGTHDYMSFAVGE